MNLKQRRQTIDDLFVSKVRVKAVSYFVLNPDTSIHLRGAVRALDEEINAVRRELMRLEEVGLLTSEKSGNKKFFTLNKEHVLLPALIQLIHRSFGLGAEIIQNKEALGELQFALLTPAFTKGFEYGDQVLELLVIGNINLKKLEELVEAYKSKEDRELRYSVLKIQDLNIRRRRQDTFLYNILVQDIVMLIGTREGLLGS